MSSFRVSIRPSSCWSATANVRSSGAKPRGPRGDIRLAMETNIGKLGTGGGIVEADETYIGRKPGVPKGRGGFGHKNTVLALVVGGD
jgi:hypothetical protein